MVSIKRKRLKTSQPSPDLHLALLGTVSANDSTSILTFLRYAI